MVHCHDMKLGQVLVCEECGLEIKVAKTCIADSKHPKGVSCTRCVHVCCDKDMKLKERASGDGMCEDVPKKDVSGRGVGASAIRTASLATPSEPKTPKIFFSALSY
jgi:hypothetical protein